MRKEAQEEERQHKAEEARKLEALKARMGVPADG